MKYSSEPSLRVGIMTATDLKVTYHGGTSPEFTLNDVVIGKNFHWERKESQRFKGELLIINNPDGTLTAANVVPLEEYLHSVISSEMNACASAEFLKAHAVISRSWILAQVDRDNRYHGISSKEAMESCATDDAIVRWYDHDDHVDFDVCADDHCQRYQGVTRATSPTVSEAIDATRGLVLTFDGKICDARFSKCCGGITEEFQNCWQPMHHDYLRALPDTPDAVNKGFPDLTVETNARQWIETAPNAYCNTRDIDLLEKVLNNYDREDTDFYRWTVTYTSHELNELVKRRSGIDFGEILEITPIQRGPSGRIVLLEIKGSLRQMLVGKELEIRRWLSPSHLKSSAFVVDRDDMGRWIIRGAGWGHGVGLCQIGAAVMASGGSSFTDILHHYFPGATLEKVY